jgi:hypothetical protein
VRITWLAAFVYLRARSLTDDLVDLLIETIHQIGVRAERKVERELLDDLKRVTGKRQSNLDPFKLALVKTELEDLRSPALLQGLSGIWIPNKKTPARHIGLRCSILGKSGGGRTGGEP